MAFIYRSFTLRSCWSLRHIRHWISRKPLEIRSSNGPPTGNDLRRDRRMTSHDPERGGSWSWPQYILRAPYLNKKAVLSRRWPRDVRYISRSWAVAEIWPFEIIQDGGCRHLEFVRIENSALRSAVPENPTLEQNMKWIGRPVAAAACNHLKFFQHGGRHHLGFVRTINSAVRSTVPKTPP